MTIKNVATQVVRGTDSNDARSYVFDILPPGDYEITVEMASFQTSRIALTLVAAQRAQVDVTLKVGQSNQTVEVQSDSAALQTQNATVGSVMEEKSVQDMPLNGRNLFSLVQTAPGVNQGPGGGVQTGTRPDDRRKTTSVSANGQNEAFNNNGEMQRTLCDTHSA